MTKTIMMMLMTKTGMDVGKGKYLFTDSRNANWCGHYKNSHVGSSKSKTRSTTQTTVPLLSIYLKESISYYHNTCSSKNQLFILLNPCNSFSFPFQYLHWSYFFLSIYCILGFVCYLSQVLGCITKLFIWDCSIFYGGISIYEFPV